MQYLWSRSRDTFHHWKRTLLRHITPTTMRYPKGAHGDTSSNWMTPLVPWAFAQEADNSLLQSAR